MPVLSNAKHERFAQGVAKGLSATEAYLKAGYTVEEKSAAEAGSRLSRNIKVRDRITELQERAAKQVGVTLESLTEELEAARQLAMKDEKGASAAVAASMGKAKLHGFLVERSENVNHNYEISDEPMTEEDWAKEHAAEH
jgi:phage terminase small subunit